MQPGDNAANDSVITPVRQESVTLLRAEVVAVQLPDGRIGAVLASLCEAHGLHTASQTRRIRLDDVLAGELVSVAITTTSGVQTMGVLTAWAIPLRLTPAVLAAMRQGSARLAQENRATSRCANSGADATLAS
jgi:hypothetical protein